jgi:hypothetical protein
MGGTSWRLFDPDQEFLVHQGYIYVPLLRDPEIDLELESKSYSCQADGPPHQRQSGTSPPPLLKLKGRWFSQTVAATSLWENFGLVFPKALAARRRQLMEQYSLTAELWGLSLDPHLITILFHILPHFLRREGLPLASRLKEDQVLDLLCRNLRVPGRYIREAQNYKNLRPLKESLERLESASKPRPSLPEGFVTGTQLRNWWEENLRIDLLKSLRRRLLRELEERERLGNSQEDRLAVLLYLAERGALELNGFGFSRIGKSQEYRIYKRTGAFALQDYYGRLYLFPDCRVAVSTSGRLRPVVLDHYKHPFLRRHAAGQEICLKSDTVNLPFSAQNAIWALEEGINALFYGYDRRRRNGYHSLDEPPGKLRLVHFDDYRIPADHPLIVSGQVEVKNRDL